MSPLRRITYALVVSTCVHFLFLVALSGQWGSRSGPFKVPGLLLVELIRLGSRGAEARIAPDAAAFLEEITEVKEDIHAETQPALNVERSAGEDSIPAVKRSSKRERSSVRKRNLKNGEPDGAQPTLPRTSDSDEHSDSFTRGTGADPIPGDKDIHPARCASCPQPPYPALALERGIEGEVGLSVQVLADGLVGDIFVEMSSGYPFLDEAALKGVKGWAFHPATGDGSAAASIKHVKIRFSLGMP